MVGLGVVVFGMWALAWYFSTNAGAAMLGQTVATKADDIVNPLNTVWVLIAAFLVFFMQAGFMMLEAGFGRTREVSNIMLECIADTCLCGVLFWAFGFAFMFGSGNGWIGHQYFFLNNAPETYGSSGHRVPGVLPVPVRLRRHVQHDHVGCDGGPDRLSAATSSTASAVSGFIYPIIGHWIWGPDGWLATMDTPFRDFAGSTVVHTVGGIIALTGAIALGRPAKTQQKISGLRRSEDTTRHRYAIRGYISTAGKHGADVLTALREALLGRPWMPPIPSPA